MTGNSAQNGGGAYSGSLNNCTLTGNSASNNGGGASQGTLNNCAIAGNSASWGGGGADSSDLNNCTVTGNAANYGGGAYSGTVNNCIVYYNAASREGINYSSATLNYCCTVPVPADGAGNVTAEPQLASVFRLSVGSACRGAGNPIYSTGTDIDGEPWLNPPSIGCDEYCAGALTGPLTVAIEVSRTNVAVGFAVELTGWSSGRVAASAWDFGDGTISSNRPYANHAWTAPGTYTVVFRAYNQSNPEGVIETGRIQVLAQPVCYVSAASLNPVPPYSSWSTAARTIQAAVDAAVVGGQIVVTNGVYDTGGRAVYGTMTNRVAVDKPLLVSSVNGPEVTLIEGYQVPGTTNGDGAIRCVYLTNGAVLRGFTLTNGATRCYPADTEERSGGGVMCESMHAVVTNCTVAGNSADFGGGACYGTLNNCTLTGNSARLGGGADGSTLNNCTLRGNSAGYGGGAEDSTLNNCTVTGNSADAQGGGADGSTLNNCTLTGNSARWGGGADGSYLTDCTVTGNSAEVGGGADGGGLKNCTVTGNSADGGGGANDSSLENCTVTGNSAIYGGGARYSSLVNCIVYDNRAISSGSNYYHGTFINSCTTPPPTGSGNIDQNPLFRDAQAGDLRLRSESPCIDAGINQDWMFGAVDLDGNPRILNGTVDMGAYETPFTVNLRVLLEGPYDTNVHAMLAGNPTNLPTTPPYAADPRQVPSIPSNVVDWVLVELRGTNGHTVIGKSAFLSTEGQVLSLDGNPGITAEVPAGYYSIVVKHRNHLAVMSAQPMAFTNYLVAYDFTMGADKYSGGSNATVQLEPGVWGMLAGDADGDGEILSVDRSVCTNQLGQSGYYRADFNLDGVVSTTDLALWMANQGRTTYASDGETMLSLALTVSPARKTLLAGTTQAFSVPGRTGAVTWAMVKNPSGATLTSLNATSAVYQAGSVSNCVDIVEAWDVEGRLGRAYVNVISAAEVARAGKAIIIAGQKSLEDPLWPVTDYLGDLAYNTLLYRGFSKPNIRYLNPVTNQDVDGNGEVDDITLPTTLTNVADTFTNWAVNPDRMFIYLVDHGGSSSGAGYFRLNAAEVLTAAALEQWLDTIQARYSNEVVVVIDCCESGSFLQALVYGGPGKRTVLTACATNEPTYFVGGGQVSFSDAFFGGLLMGLDLQDAFVLARDAMSPYQSAWVDADGNGLYQSAVDPVLVAGVYIGPSFVAGKDVPQIGHVLGNQALRGTSRATLWAYDITSIYPLDRVWCVVVPPGHDPDPANPVGDLPLLDLTYNATEGRYEATYNGFTQLGVYNVLYYARDIWGSVSAPRQSYVTQNRFEERVILVAGGSTNDVRWSGIANLGRLAYHTFRSRWLDPQTIYYLNPCAYEDADQDGTNDVAALPTLDNLQNAITSWASNANKLTVFLVGQGSNGVFSLNASENLSAASLKAWLDSYQASNGEASVVLDFPGAGAFLPALAPRAAQSRVCVASTGAGQDCLFANGGTVSFSQYFLSDVFNGFDIGRAFEHARQAILSASGRLRQLPLLDDNGDGVGDKRDGLLARQRYIGPAFLTGADLPFLGTVMPNATLNGPGALLLWVSDLTAVKGVSNVWCVITPPDYKGLGDLPQTNLTWNADSNRYEVLYPNFTLPGTYVCTFYARDNLGEISSPAQSEVTVTDAYEIDDSPVQATMFPVDDTQAHNLHWAWDEDWVMFYAPTGFVFNVEAKQLGTNSDVRLDLYCELPNGILMAVDGVDRFGRRPGFVESLELNLKTNPLALSPGVYYVRVSAADTNLFGPGSEYELRIYASTGPDGGPPFPPGFDNPGPVPIGFFNVYLGPPQALAAGAGWRILQAANEVYTNDFTTYSLPVPPPWTNWILSFRAISGFDAPTNRSLVITSNRTTGVMAYYLYTNVSPRAECPVIGTNGTVQFTFLANAGKRYAIEESTNLLNWVPLVTNQVPRKGLLRFSRSSLSGNESAFYRARFVP